jgi:hypothetical protein
VLEKKWTSLARLKMQLLQLEKENKKLKENQFENMPESLSALAKAGDGLPKEPEKY